MGKTLYEIFEHTADVGLRVRAATREQLFVEAARGLLSIVIANPQQIRPLSTRTIRVEGQELDYLMFDWLNEVLYTLDAEKFLVGDCQVRLDEQGLSATCRGEQLDPERHESDHEIKAITYHGLRVEETPDGWLAEVIVDI